MSVPLTTAPLPSISSYQESRQTRREHLGLPPLGVGANLLIPGLASPYPSPPMSRRSSTKYNWGNVGQEPNLAALTAARTSTTAATSRTASLSAQQQQQQQQYQQHGASPVSESGFNYGTGVPAAATASQPSPQRTLISASSPTAASAAASYRSQSGYQYTQVYQFQSSTPYTLGLGGGSSRSSASNRNPKQHVQRACVHCKEGHLSCDGDTPCGRCVRNGKAATCVRVEHKKRGRPRTRHADSSPTSTQASPLEGFAHEVSPKYSHQSQLSASTGDPTSLEPTNSVTASARAPSQSDYPVAFLDMDFNVARFNEQFQRRFSFLGELHRVRLEELVDPTFANAIRHLRIVLLEERDMLNPPHLPPIRSLDAPHVGQIPTIESQDLATICGDQAPRRETWYFRRPEGGTQPLQIELCLARTEIFFLTLVILTDGQRQHSQASDKTISPIATPAPPLQSASPTQPSQYPALRRSRRYSRPLSEYVNTAQAAMPPSTTSGLSVNTSSTAAALPPYSTSPFSTASASPDSLLRAPRSDLYQFVQSQGAARRRSIGGSSGTASAQTRRRQRPPTMAWKAIEVMDPTTVYNPAYLSNPRGQPAPQSQLYGLPPPYTGSTPQGATTTPSSRTQEFQLPPLANYQPSKIPSALPPPPSPSQRLLEIQPTQQAPLEEPSAPPSTSTITPLRRQESKKEQSRQRAAAREERAQEHETEVAEPGQPSSGGRETRSSSQRPPSRKRTIHDT